MIGAPVYIAAGVLGCLLVWLGRYEQPRRVFGVRKPDEPNTFDQDFNTVRDRYGLFQNNEGGLSPSANGISITSDRYILRHHHGVIEHEISLRELLRSCVILRGVYRRSPTADNKGTRIDDLVRLASAAQLLDPSIVADILSAGRSRAWWYSGEKIKWSALVKNPKKELEPWLGRYPGLIAHFEYCAGERPSTFKAFVWSLGVAWCAFNEKNSQDGWVLSQRLIESYEMTEYRTYFQDKIVKYWHKRFYKFWPGGMRQLWIQYFGWYHPLAKWAIDP